MGLGAGRWPLALFAVLAFVLLSVNWPTVQADVPEDSDRRSWARPWSSPDQFLLPFEVASVLLLVALVGAVIIAREK